MKLAPYCLKLEYRRLGHRKGTPTHTIHPVNVGFYNLTYRLFLIFDDENAYVIYKDQAAEQNSLDTLNCLIVKTKQYAITLRNYSFPET